MLKVSNLSVGRGGISLLNDVNFMLKAGQALVLRGPNGVGKTTLLRCVAGLQDPVLGDINLEGSVAYAAHAEGIKGSMSVFENLKFWADVYGGSMTEEVLLAYKLNDLAQRPAANLSAGQKRRLSLTRMLVTGCDLWIMDEPTASLDAENIALFYMTIDSHLQAGGAALLSAHNDLNINAETLDLAQFCKARNIVTSNFDEPLE